MSELLPCPFCGGAATVGANEYYDGANTFYIYCASCGVQQMTTKIRTDEAVAAWNRRTDNNQPQGISKTYSVDFDGYLCKNEWPDIGKPNKKIIEHFKELKAAGNKLILNTCREGDLLDNAIEWCREHGLYFDAHNKNLPERIAQYGGDCRKISADHYCDDKNYWLMPEGD